MLSMFQVLLRHKLLFAATVFATLLLSAVGVSSAFVLQILLDAIINGNWELFHTMIWVVGIFCVAIGVTAYLSSICTKKLIVLCVWDMRHNIYQGILARDTEAFQQVNTADYISAISNDVKIVEENALVPFLGAIHYVFLFIMAAIALFYYSPIIAGLMFASLLVTIVIPASLGKPISRRQGLLSESFALFTVKLKDQLLGYEVIRSFQMTDKAQSDYEAQNTLLAKKKFSVEKFLTTSEGLSIVLGGGTQLFVMLAAGYLVLQGELSPGVLLAVLQLSGIFVQPISIIMQSVPSIIGTRPIRQRIYELSNPEPSAFQGKEEPVWTEGIEFDEVSFGYIPEQQVLNKLSVRLEKNKKYTVVGGSGSGKTTLVRLLCANYTGYTGTISFSGRELHELDINQLLTHIAFIHQNVYMFDESIKENISLHKEYSASEWEEALSASGVDRFLDQMENGLDTQVGENGINLSGGQRQRVAVARALIQKKPILIIDEGTSAVDRQTAYEIETALLAMPQITLITITHHLASELLRQYDRILFLQNGQVAESGTYDELIQKQAHFAEFTGV